jgi:hypothetical protein
MRQGGALARDDHRRGRRLTVHRVGQVVVDEAEVEAVACVLISLSSRDSPTTGLGNSLYHSSGARLEVRIDEPAVWGPSGDHTSCA